MGWPDRVGLHTQQPDHAVRKAVSDSGKSQRLIRTSFRKGFRFIGTVDERDRADKPAIPFKVPAGIKLIRVDAKSGMRVGPGEGGRTILEAFKPGTAPPDNYAAIGVPDPDGRQLLPPDADRNLFSPGTGRLY